MMRPAHLGRRLAALEARDAQAVLPRTVLVWPGQPLPEDLWEHDLVLCVVYEGAEDDGGTVCDAV